MKPRKHLDLLEILERRLTPAKSGVLIRVWALERKIAALSGRPRPSDIHIILNAFEDRERALVAEFAELEKSV
jgi:hypothetical protein